MARLINKILSKTLHSQMERSTAQILIHSFSRSLTSHFSLYPKRGVVLQNKRYLSNFIASEQVLSSTPKSQSSLENQDTEQAHPDTAESITWKHHHLFIWRHCNTIAELDHQLSGSSHISLTR